MTKPKKLQLPQRGRPRLPAAPSLPLPPLRLEYKLLLPLVLSCYREVRRLRNWHANRATICIEIPLWLTPRDALKNFPKLALVCELVCLLLLLLLSLLLPLIKSRPKIYKLAKNYVKHASEIMSMRLSAWKENKSEKKWEKAARTRTQKKIKSWLGNLSEKHLARHENINKHKYNNNTTTTTTSKRSLRF